ncbi:uncharacterized protein BJ212DRAFT_1484212 [Suillus subaureus]|uniref:Uncharacterized protein n=1 Tax=Suillus subaureus TaxID=48587 RepID=A0A9P7JA60_9AGAM|nr:uncharacterized protein BJ212DRAFT_1484212 [Suillus subaureus]KAG1810637.1 hypothetical protein BJ212DRAFT_1484212 [Suillus subaureus]
MSPQVYVPSAPPPPSDITSAMQSMLHVLFLPTPFKSSVHAEAALFGREPDGNPTQILDTALTLTPSKRIKKKFWRESGRLHVHWHCPSRNKDTVLKNADEMLNFTCSKEQQLERIFKEIADSGIRVIAGSSVGDLALYYPNRFNIKVLSKSDSRRVAHVVNATPLARVSTLTPKEASYVDIFEMTEIDGDRVTVLCQLAHGEDGHQSHAEETRTVLRGRGRWPIISTTSSAPLRLLL